MANKSEALRHTFYDPTSTEALRNIPTKVPFLKRKSPYSRHISKKPTVIFSQARVDSEIYQARVNLKNGSINSAQYRQRADHWRSLRKKYTPGK